MISIVLWLIFLLASIAVGKWLLPLFKLQFNKLESYLISFCLGTGFFMLAIFGLGILGMLNMFAVSILFIAAIALFRINAVNTIKDSIGVLYFFRQRIKISLNALLWLALLFFILINFIPAFAPIFEFDSTTYHVSFAKEYVEKGNIVYLPSSMYTVMPQGMTMLYTIGELFSSPATSQLIAFGFSLIAIFSVYALTRNYSENAAIISSLLFMMSPVIIERLAQTMVDLTNTALVLVALVVIWNYIKSPNASAAFLAGIIIGIIGSIKLTVIFYGFGLGLILLMHQVFSKKIQITHLVIVGVGVLLVMSPWLIRSYAITENPIYPQGASVFGGPYLEPSFGNAYAVHHEKFGLERNIINTLLAPWHLTFNSKAFDAPLGIHPFYFMLIPLILVFNHKEKRWWILLAGTYAMIIVIFWMHPLLRYMFPVLGLLSVLSGKLINDILKVKTLKLVFLILLACGFLFSMAIWYGTNSKSVIHVVSGQSDAEFYGSLKDYNSYAAMSWINQNTAIDSVIILFNEPRGYFLERDYLTADIHMNYINLNSADIGARLEELSVDYILINEAFNYQRDESKDKINQLVEKKGNLVFEDEFHKVYEFRP